MSPFLFILVMDVLSRFTSLAESQGAIHGIKNARQAPPIPHHLLADDLMFFCRANLREANEVHRILTTFEKWSGQTINLAKSFLHFSRNVGQQNKEQLSSILRLQQAHTPGTYLGLPLTLNRSKVCAFNEVKEKVQRRVAGWKARALSQAGRIVLIQAEAAALPSYTMSVFLLPKAICTSLDSILKNL